ncbi:MAG: carboxypeptidase regulatory-like domain-containing protein [Fibrobacteres bacterium]|nr:carboxypeptidase regulatory-like domain-containing protein [Fibrobacterota bacterium]
MPMRRIPIPGSKTILFISAILLLIGCLGGGGSGSETTLAGVTGRVVDAQGQPLEGAAVHIRPEEALSSGRLGTGGTGDDPAAAYTKADGTFLVEGLAAGDYNVECRASGGAALLQAHVKDTLVHLPDAVIRPTGAMRGRIAKPSEGEPRLGGAYVSIPGLPIGTFVQLIGVTDSSFVLGNIPAGVYTVAILPGYADDLARFKILDMPAIRVEPGDTTDLGSLILPLRAGPQDSAYLRDSAAFAAWVQANGITQDHGGIITNGVKGNRITMLWEIAIALTRLTPDIEALDQVDYVNFQAPEDSGRYTLAGAEELGHLHALRTLGLWEYRLEGDLDWLRSLTELEEISIGFAGLKTFPVAVEELPFLRTLMLDGDSLDVLPASVGKMKQLLYLDLSQSILVDLPSELSELRNLQELHLYGNRFASLPPAVLSLHSLRRLTLAENRLTTLPRELMAMPALRGLNVRGNRLCGLSQDWKDWLKYQDSLWYSKEDTSIYKWPKGTLDSGWEAGQHCAAP